MNPGISIDRLAKILDQLGAPLPDTIADVAATQDAIRGLVYTKPLIAFEAELAAGQITAANADERIRAAALAQGAHKEATEIARAAEPILDRLERTSLAAAGDTIVTSMRPAFDQAVIAATVFVERYGTHPDAETVLASSPDAAELWHAQQHALAVFDGVSRVGRMLAATRGYYVEPDATWYVSHVANQAELSQIVAAFSAGGILELIAEGFRPTLNTADEARSVLDPVNQRAIEDETKRKADEAAELAAFKAEIDHRMEQSAEQARAMHKKIGLTR